MVSACMTVERRCAIRIVIWVLRAETKSGAIGAQITALRAVQVAEAHDAGGHRTRQGQRFAFEDGINR
jgi:hypothetical protein